jgi:hypothetical protein
MVAGCSPGDDGNGPDGSDWDGDTGGGGDADADGDADAPWDGTPPPDDGGRPEFGDYHEEVCDEEGFEIARIIPDMLIVLDRSNSMEIDRHWNPVREAIYAVTGAMDRQIWFGLMVFPNAQDPGACVGSSTNQCAPAVGTLVPCAEGNFRAIRDTLGLMVTCGGTPTAETLEAAKSYLQMLSPVTGHPPFILLATDGAPNCNAELPGASCTCTGAPGSCASYSSNCLDDARTYAVISELRAVGIQTFVVGIAVSAWRTVLDEMALRGGTGAAFMAEDAASIRTAFEDIAGAIASCEFDMRSPSPSADPGLVNFYFDGEAVPRDRDGPCDNGWAWMDEEHTRIQFCGTYCSDLLGRRVGEVTATWGCPTILI